MKLLKNAKPLTPVLILSLLGVLLSLYLTFNHFFSESLKFCITGKECDIVQQSSYSSLMGIPVALVGVLGYATIIATIFSSLSGRIKWILLFIFSTVGVSFSVYLTYIEIFEIKAICSFCVISALLMLLIFYFVLNTANSMLPKLSFINIFVFALVIFSIVFVGTHLLYSLSPPTYAEHASTSSSDFQMKLAKHLTQKGAIMYGSFKCPHCNHQKRLFGNAFKYIRYVECHPKGPNANPSFCLAKGIRRYPSWEIDGRFYEGMLSLEQLAKISRYKMRKD